MKPAEMENMVILIVEDDELIRSVVKSMCELWDFKVILMEDGFKASAYLEQNPLPEPVPTFALLDIRMPGPWGHEIGQKIRGHSQLNDIGIVMMTAYELRRSEEEDVFKISGADRILYKPLPAMDELQKLIEEVLISRRLPVKKDRDEPAALKIPVRPIVDTHLSVFYPQEVQTGKCYRASVYVHLESALVAVRKDLEADITAGGPTSPNDRSRTSSRIITGTPITVTPECSGLAFNPPRLTQKWGEDWVRFLFDFESKPDRQTGTVQVQVILRVFGVEIGRVDFVSHIVPSTEDQSLPEPKNPLALKTQPIYKKVFISYSHSDKPVVEAIHEAKQALGDEMFPDTYTVRTSGTGWQETLAKAIDQADILQLFWSEEAASSVGIRAEWTYALQNRCPKTRCQNFIRPIYWQQPIPAKPIKELAHLPFTYVPLDKDGE